MRKTPWALFLTIVVIASIALLINIPPEIRVAFTIPKLPFTKSAIKVDKTIPGFRLNYQFGTFHIQKDLSFKKGLDLEGGTSVTLRADMKNIPPDKRNDALDSAKSVIERRVNFYGVSEPVVETAKTNNDYRIIVEIPGVTDVNQAIQLIGQTAKLTFWEEGASSSAQMASESASLLPLGITTILGPNPHETNLTGSDLQQATVAFDPNSGEPQVRLSFNGTGARKFADITKRNIGKIVAIVLDNQIITAPRVSEVITQGSASITGSFTTDQAKELAVQLNAGALPVPLSVLEQHAIGATLGSVSLQKSLIAGVIGFLVIVVFMISLYGNLGVMASVALFIYTMIVLALFRLIPVTLTLAGIAGLILSIGIAVDANILIFERMKEELRRGRPKHVALELGFQRAWASIRDSNMASLITSGILYYFGTGIIRGFALTLALGVLVSLFSAITITRTFLRVFYNE